MGTVVALASLLVALFVLVGIQLAFVGAGIAWVNSRSDYDSFRRWRAALFIAASSLLVIDGLVAFGLLILQFWPSVTPGDPASTVARAVLSPFTILLGAGVGVATVVFGLVVVVGAVLQMQIGADTLTDLFGWLDRYWRNPHGRTRKTTILPEQHFL